MSGVVDKIKAKVEDVFHKDHTTSSSHNTTHTGVNDSTVGTGHNTHHGQHHTAGNGPHDSSTANAVDPRVNSNTGYNTTGSSTSGYGQSGYTGGSTNAGPHDSNIANKLDPRVDSDRDGSRTTNQGYGTTGSTTSGYDQSGYTGGSTNAGPHSSNIANKLDPRVDSDLDGSRTANQYGSNQGYGTTGSSNSGYGQSGYTGGSTNTGPHSSNIANKLDPRVDSDADGSRNFGAAQHGPGATHNAATGPARDTAGPHASNTLNKLDPRVDSDADGSRNFGAAQHGAGGQYNNNTQGGFGGNSTY